MPDYQPPILAEGIASDRNVERPRGRMAHERFTYMVNSEQYNVRILHNLTRRVLTLSRAIRLPNIVKDSFQSDIFHRTKPPYE